MLVKPAIKEFCVFLPGGEEITPVSANTLDKIKGFSWQNPFLLSFFTR